MGLGWRTRRSRRGRTAAAALVVAVAVVVVAVAGCSAGRSDDPGATGTPADEAAAERFCTWWATAMATGDADLATITDPPAPIRAPLAVMVAAEEDGGSAAGDLAAREVLNWAEVRCRPAPVAGDPAGRRVAPPAGALEASLRPCLVWSPPPDDRPREGGMVLYGSQSGDPYDGPMVGVVWGPEGTGAGDGDRTPVRVRGTDGQVAPITVFQQRVPEGLGLVVAWEEAGTRLSLYGRGWETARTGELVALADHLAADGAGGYTLDAAALPPDWGIVHEGDAQDLSFMPIGPGATYRVHYQREGSPVAVLVVEGRVVGSSAAAAVRFLAPALTPARVAGRDVLAGEAWAVGGPAVVTWREDDGLVVRVVGLGLDLAEVTTVAEATRELDVDAWAALVTSTTSCSGLSGPGGAPDVG